MYKHVCVHIRTNAIQPILVFFFPARSVWCSYISTLCKYRVDLIKPAGLGVQRCPSICAWWAKHRWQRNVVPTQNKSGIVCSLRVKSVRDMDKWETTRSRRRASFLVVLVPSLIHGEGPAGAFNGNGCQNTTGGKANTTFCILLCKLQLGQIQAPLAPAGHKLKVAVSTFHLSCNLWPGAPWYWA